jgi:transcriptional regulator with XRE-family HTH domain
MPERTVSSRLSADVIDFLCKRGMTLAEIGAAIGATKSFISRVRSGERGLTIDHLIALEQKVGEPLPLLLLRATPIESVRKDLRPLYRMTEKMLANAPDSKPRRAVRRRSNAA